jgi:hypothetical protein
MQAQYTQPYSNTPPQQAMAANGYAVAQQQPYTNAPPQQHQHVPTEAELNSPFKHLLQVPLFPFYSMSEVEVIRKALQTNAETNKLRQEIIANMQPDPSAADALTAKVVYEFIGAMSDGGTSLVLRQFNPDKLSAGAMGMLDAMERKMMEDNQVIVYSRWATYKDAVSGPPVILDIFTHHSFSDPTKMRGIEVKTNTDAKFKFFDKFDITVKVNKEWRKTWFRGRFHKLSVVMLKSDGTQVELGRVVEIQRSISPNVSVDMIKRWQKHRVPQA